ncbi:uncharacterized protein LOC109716653 isoform X2 [Ananas comosus]|uniref:Uncharacterized protein LOC109716653 isoform X2 n=1 Tax=Ananas comosus TaxID=4615 RepID=A0A6P5FW94_ANACO|nr:uncharacterized protein LOC109716653 isoform X2 [Ananas comosus]
MGVGEWGNGGRVEFGCLVGLGWAFPVQDVGYRASGRRFRPSPHYPQPGGYWARHFPPIRLLLLLRPQLRRSRSSHLPSVRRRCPNPRRSPEFRRNQNLEKSRITGITKHLEKNQNPSWHQVFAFSKDCIQANFVGRIVFDLTDVPLAPQWYKLEDKKGDKLSSGVGGGELMLAVWIGTQADEAFPDAWHSVSLDVLAVVTLRKLSAAASRVPAEPRRPRRVARRESPLARPALPQRHRSLHQWDDLFGSPFPANPVKEPHVSYPKKRKDSLSVRDNDQFILRKRRKKWSSLEEETLRKSVESRDGRR